MNFPIIYIFMVDIYGRPPQKSRDLPEDLLSSTMRQIKDEISDLLSLTDVDPGELVVFQDEKGKLRTSDVSIGDIFIKSKSTKEGNIAVYDKYGKIVPNSNSPDSIKASIEQRLLKSGDVMTGDLNMGMNKVINVKTDSDVATKNYVDEKSQEILQADKKLSGD